mgnify:CR=1 FL=1
MKKSDMVNSMEEKTFEESLNELETNYKLDVKEVTMEEIAIVINNKTNSDKEWNA